MTARTCTSCGTAYVNPPATPGTPGRRYRGDCGYCPRCYNRWKDHGFPVPGPPAPQRSGRVAGRVEDYTELRSWGLSAAEAALRLGITRRTIQRYEAALRSGETRAA